MRCRMNTLEWSVERPVLWFDLCVFYVCLCGGVESRVCLIESTFIKAPSG